MNRIWSPHILKRIAVPGSSRQYSAWVNAARSDTDRTLSREVDVEKLFIDPDVQSLMYDLTGLDLESKIFKPRRTGVAQRSHFALMTDERLGHTMEKMREEASHFLNFVPVKEPRSEEVTILSKDEEIAQFDTSKFVFTDITFDATDQDRTVVVREIDGTLRTATVEEHDRMNRTYYPKEDRPIFPPKVFSETWLQNALDRNEHEFVLDWACYFYEPDDPAFVKLSRSVYDAVVNDGKFDIISSTRHFGPFVFYIALNGNIPPLLNYYGGKGKIRECAKLIRLQKTLHPNWRVSIGTGDSDEKIVNDFLKQNTRFQDQLIDLKKFLRHGTIKVNYEHQRSDDQLSSRKTFTKTVAVDMKNVGTTEGPLGELSAEYSVKVSTGDVEEEPAQAGQKPKKDGRGRRKFAPKNYEPKK